VSAALLLIGSALAVLYVVIIVRMFLSPPVVSGRTYPWVPIVVAVLVSLAFALEFGLLLAIAFRQRWAYIAYLVVVALSVPYAASGAKGNLERGPGYVALFIVGWAIQIAVVVLLLRRSAREWYGFGRAGGGRSGERKPELPGGQEHL
jgi:uncharacterized membrane protein YGL010W